VGAVLFNWGWAVEVEHLDFVYRVCRECGEVSWQGEGAVVLLSPKQAPAQSRRLFSSLTQYSWC
jgi:hypothetical protein